MYLLFGYPRYYPNGGWNDFKGRFKTIKEARKHCEGDHYHIVDAQTLEVVERGDVNPFKILPLSSNRQKGRPCTSS